MACLQFVQTEKDTATGRYWNELAEGIFNESGRTFTVEDTNVVYESACEVTGNCNIDQQTFKSVFVKSLADVRDLIPGTSARSNITSILTSSAAAAATSCTEEYCEFVWYEEQEDGLRLGSELNALEAFLANLPTRQLVTGNNATTAGGSASPNTETGGSQTDVDSEASPDGTGSASGFAASSVLAMGGMLAMFFF
jgi:mannan endo-1,6-alpha-mannosidase